MKRKQCTFKLSFIERSFIWLVAVYFVASIITGLTSCGRGLTPFDAAGSRQKCGKGWVK